MFKVLSVAPDTQHPGFYVVTSKHGNNIVVSTSAGLVCLWHGGFSCGCTEAVKAEQERARRAGKGTDDA